MSHDAFVSYSSEESIVAYQMVDYLESCGIRCWVAPRDVPGGRNYAEVILTALADSDLFFADLFREFQQIRARPA